MNYGKKMFLNSTIAYISVHALKFIMSIKLPSEDVGAYSILLTISGLTTFLLINLNKVFAPAISKLYSDGKTKELNTLYKKTTILVNLITLPLVVIILLFSDEILLLYTTQMLEYKSFLLFMLIGGIMSLASGSSGTFMIMAGLENKNLNILIIKSILIIILSFYFIPIYGMSSIVFLYVFFMFFVNFLQVFFIKRLVNISPFTYQLFILYIITTMFIYFAFNQDYTFSLFHYIVIPIFIYLIYFISMISTVKKLVKELIY
jgi:O-antigen/teichoic acid export membrane protein